MYNCVYNFTCAFVCIACAIWNTLITVGKIYQKLNSQLYVHGSVHRESNLITVQQDAAYSVYYISVGSSTCFVFWHPSSGARTAVITASGINISSSVFYSLQSIDTRITLFHAATCFKHMCSSSGDQNCITQPLVSSHLSVTVPCTPTCVMIQMLYNTLFFYVLLTVHLSIFFSVINQFDAQNFCFTISLFHASTCFEHMWSSSGGQNCITQPLVSSHL